MRIAVPGRSLVLVAGLPGAGKSTLLGTLVPDPSVVVLDSDAHRAALRGVLHPLPYAVYRPLVHLSHRVAAVFATWTAVRVVVVHLPATSRRSRAAVARIAAMSRREAHLVWPDVDAEVARRGQIERGRVVPPASFERHAARAAASRPEAGEAGWESVTVVGRGSVALELLPCRAVRTAAARS